MRTADAVTPMPGLIVPSRCLLLWMWRWASSCGSLPAMLQPFPISSDLWRPQKERQMMLSLEEWLADSIVVSLILYVLFGGADFGAGVWYLADRGERERDQRHLIRQAIGPIWEANHVWLILAVTLLFTAFPPAFARVTTVLHVPLTLLLLAIVGRGATFSFAAMTPEPMQFILSGIGSSPARACGPGAARRLPELPLHRTSACSSRNFFRQLYRAMGQLTCHNPRAWP